MVEQAQSASVGGAVKGLPRKLETHKPHSFMASEWKP